MSNHHFAPSKGRLFLAVESEGSNDEAQLLFSDRFALYRPSEQPSVESREISEGIVLDYDAAGNLVGIDIDNASRKVDLKKLTLSGLFNCAAISYPALKRAVTQRAKF